MSDFEEGYFAEYSDHQPFADNESKDDDLDIEEAKRDPLYKTQHTNMDGEEEEIFDEDIMPTLADVKEELLVDDDEEEEDEVEDEEEDDSSEEFTPSNHWEEKAVLQGWRPQEEFEGNAEDWVDARTFVKNGELFDVIHALKRDNKQMKDALTDQSTLIKQAVEHGKSQVLAELHKERREARDIGDYEKEEELIDKIAELKAAKVTVPSGDEESNTEANDAPQYRITPEEKAQWVMRNPWFNTDPVANKSAVLLSESYLAANPEASGADILSYVTTTMKETRPDLFKNKAKKKPSAVNRSKNAGNTGKAKKAKSSLPNYSQLKREHQEQCDRYTQSTGLSRKQWIKDFAAVNGFADYDL